MQQQCILVLGMHRSGTSALSGMLNILGIYQGRHFLPSSSFNPKGFFENEKVLHFNRKLLAEHGSSYDDIFFTDKTLFTDKYSEELKSLILEEFGSVPCFSIKDPRICLLFPIYEKALSDMGILIRPAIIYRNPMETAVSLQKRDGFSLEKGMIMWLEHFLLSEKHTRLYPRLFIEFNQILKDHFSLISAIEDNWQLPIEIDPDKLEKIRTFLQSSSKHINIPLNHLAQKLPDSMQPLVQILSEPEEISRHQSTLDEIRQAYFREKSFFFLKEFRDSLKETAPYKYAQFYIDTGQGFSESQSQHVLNPEDKESIELDLSQFSNVKGIRFDPLNQPVALSIISAAFHLENDEWRQAVATPLNASCFFGEIDYFSFDDPQYYIPIPSFPSRVHHLVIRADYHKAGHRNVTPIIFEMLKQLLQRQRKNLVLRIVNGQRWWKQHSENMLRETEQTIRGLEQQLDVERQIVAEKDRKLNQVNQRLEKEQTRINQLIAENQYIKQELHNLYNSKSWRLTKPFRKLLR